MGSMKAEAPCSKCKGPRETKGGYCRKCAKEYNSRPKQKAVAKQHRDRDFGRPEAERQMVKDYGIDFEDWARLYERQGGRCEGCQQQLTFDRKTHIDHCHKTGKIRGLLCIVCNQQLGHIEKNRDRFQRLVEYLERSS